jgi:glycosyltransferase involved in cell wall biosynthesis
MLALPAERSILTIHDLVFLHTYKGITRKFLKWIFLDLPVKKARTITTISEKSKQEILQHSTCTPGKVHLIPNPVDPALSSTSSQHHSIAGATDSNIPRILFLGTKPNKNLELSIEALYTLNIHLRIIGNITAQQHLLLKKFNIDYSAAQHLSDAELINEYHQADIILFPSTYEGFGLPLLEGFQSGKPVITSNIPPMSDIAGNAALLVDPFSLDSIRGGIKQLLQDVSLRNELVKRGFEKASAYHPTIIASQYVDLWKQNDIFS